jgi:pSer/pThr/pTyr-binding forkhead associated (FHA) protein
VLIICLAGCGKKSDPAPAAADLIKPVERPAPQKDARKDAPDQLRARLVVIRGVKIGVTYPLYDGVNYLGRADQKPVDIDLEDQELPDQIWSSRQHALVRCADRCEIEDLKSSNGTYVNRVRVPPGTKRELHNRDVIQIGTIQLLVLLGADQFGERLPKSRGSLHVVRGVKLGMKYSLYDGNNYLGRSDQVPADIDLEIQEAPDRIWSSRQHALIRIDGNTATLEDLKSANGSFVNRERVYPGKTRGLQSGDVIQIGTVQMKLQLD